MKVLTAIVMGLVSFISVGQSYTSYFTGNPTNMIVSPTPPGGICMMGGASENDEAMKWFLTRAYSGDVVVIRASGSDGYNDYMYTGLGINVNSVETIVFNNANAAYDPYVIDKISKAEAIWMAGGDQWDYVSYWRNSPVDSIINEGIANRGLTIGGTSAGMAVLGRYYFSAENGTVTSNTALQNPFDTNVTVDSNRFITCNYLQDVITDTHYDSPDRRGRHVVFLADVFMNYGVEAKGIACNEYTAVCIDENGIARVFGEYPQYDEFAYFIAQNCEISETIPEEYSAGVPLTWDYVGMALNVYKAPGTMTGSSTFDLNDWQTGSGGEWLHWSVVDGLFSETSTNAPNCTNGLNESNELIVPVYPNPTEGDLSIEFNSKETRTIMLVDVNGRVVFQTESTAKNIDIDLTSFSVGVYQLTIVSEKAHSTHRVVKV